VIRVLYVHHRGELGGAPASLALLIGALDRDRFEPHVYCPPGPAAALFARAGATVHTGPVAGFTHIWASSYHGLRWLLFVRELVRLPGHIAGLRRVLASGFDVVHLNDSPLLPAAVVARRHGVPVVWHLRSAPGGGARERFLRGRVGHLAAATLAINRDVAEEWRLPAEVVPNPVDTERFAPGDREVARARLGLPAEGALVSFVGFLYPAKGYERLIRAVGLLRDGGTQATLAIAGGGVRSPAFFRAPAGRLLQRLGLARDYESEARALAAELGLGGSVRFLPYVGEVEDVYRASDVVVAPSEGPEIGRSLLEAAACGIAAVGTGSTTGGAVLEPDVTTVFARRGTKPLAESIGALLADPRRREAMGAAARLHALATFDPGRCARLVEAVYARTIEP
jgi:glycosyltransferase involved in cell wall biosynthesis